MTIENTRQAANRLAGEARRRSAQQAAQDTVAAVRQQVAGISPESAGSLGGAIDPSKGFDFDPAARPTDLPEPGSAPGGAPARQTGNPFDRPGSRVGDAVGDSGQQPADKASGRPLDDDHDAIVGQGIGGRASTTEGPARPRQPAVREGPARPQHPVLSRLREDLGLDSVRAADVEVGGHCWTLVALTPGDVATVTRLADQLSVGELEMHLTREAAVVAHAVMAIDRVPTYRVFGVEPPPGTVVTNPLRPPRAVRYVAAGKLFDFIQSEARTQLARKLYDAFVDRTDADAEVASYLDDPANTKATFRCGVAGCDHELTVVPRYRPGGRDVVLPFCRWHGSPMEMSEQELSGPLA